MTRRLTRDEHALWDRVRESAKPLKPTAANPSPEEPAPRAPPKAARAERGPAAAPAAAAPPTKKPAPPALAHLEERTLRRIGRGLIEIDARIDLHGMRQERAYAALASFLRHSQASGARFVLVVTGKGRTGSESRAVLRETVPRWLAGAEFRHLVVGFEEANRRHGGTGALYVRIRRRREGARLLD